MADGSSTPVVESPTVTEPVVAETPAVETTVQEATMEGSEEFSLPPPPMPQEGSKKAAKKRQRYEEMREKRAFKKQKVKEQKAAKREQLEKERAEKGEQSREERPKAMGPPRPPKETRALFAEKCKDSPTVLIDCEFGDYLRDAETSSLVQQVMFTYGANKRAAKPIRLALSGIEGKTAERFSKLSGFDNWWLDAIHKQPYTEVYPKERLVYLTADAEETLDTLNKDDVYIVGGIVDRNRLKGATMKKASMQGLRTAKLPLDDFVDLHGATKVLTVNHVIDIMIAYNEKQDWTQAFKKSLPGRKNATAFDEDEEKEETPVVAPLSTDKPSEPGVQAPKEEKKAEEGSVSEEKAEEVSTETPTA